MTIKQLKNIKTKNDLLSKQFSKIIINKEKINQTEFRKQLIELKEKVYYQINLIDNYLFNLKKIENNNKKNKKHNDNELNEDDFEVMDICAKPGEKVYYCFNDNGHAADRDRLKELKLKLFEVYTVEKTEPYAFETNIYLKEFPGIVFNSVNFGIKK